MGEGWRDQGGEAAKKLNRLVDRDGRALPIGEYRVSVTDPPRTTGITTHTIDDVTLQLAGWASKVTGSPMPPHTTAGQILVARRSSHSGTRLSSGA